MIDRKEALSLIFKNCQGTIIDNGFKIVETKNRENGDAPIFEDGETAYLEMTKNNLTVRLLSHDNLLDIMEKDGDEDFKNYESNLMDLESFDDRDLKSLANEVSNTIVDAYGKKSKRVQKKAPSTVSKTAVKNGMSYDAYTFASRITNVYPELKEELKENFETYDEFLSEDFFVNHANAYIMATIKENNKQKMKKLFRILCDTYENGTNAVQDLVVVTILGEINNDKELLENCHQYISDKDFWKTLVAVNEYLASGAGKKAKKLLKNPPKYKPDKKRKNMMSAMLENAEPQNL